MSKHHLTQREGDQLIARLGDRVTVGRTVEQALRKIAEKIPVEKKQVKYQQRREGDRYKSDNERLYAAELDDMKEQGIIVAWEYECRGFRIPDWGNYWPDFYVVYADEHREFHEIKGKSKFSVRDRGRAKFLDARRLYPEYRWRMIQREETGWNDIL